MVYRVRKAVFFVFGLVPVKVVAYRNGSQYRKTQENKLKLH